MHNAAKAGAILLVSVSAIGVPDHRAAADVIIHMDEGAIHSTTSMTGFGTHGDMMDGMAVTALFGDDSTEATTWAGTGPGAGSAVGVKGNGWSLSVQGDTFSLHDHNHWVLVNDAGVPMSALLLNGAPGRTVFDISPDSGGTAGSAQGRAFEERSFPDDLEVTATYRDALALGSGVPRGDTWVRLAIAFSSPGQLPPGSTITFFMDTDSAVSAILPAPGPGTGSLLLPSGLALLGRRARSR